MRAVLQRVSSASVTVDGTTTGAIGRGILLLLGAGHDDTQKDRDYIFEKTINMRIFPDEEGKMNRSLLDIEGELLVISQFTLYGDARKGRRPSFMAAMHPEPAEALYESFLEVARERLGQDRVAAGIFGADMKVSLVNDGPVTILLESQKAF